MLFNIPQFIDTEDKIVGPLTAKQLGYAFGAGTLLLVLYSTVDTTLFIILALPIMAFFGALAFYKPNGQTFLFFLQSSLAFFLHPKVYVWRKGTEKMVIKKATVTKKNTAALAPKDASQERLAEISRLLDRKN